MGFLKLLLESIKQYFTATNLLLLFAVLAIIYIWFKLQQEKVLRERITLLEERKAAADERRAITEHESERVSKSVQAGDTALKPVALEEEQPVPREKLAIAWDYQTVTLLEPETPDELEPQTPDEWRQEVWKAFDARDMEQLEEVFKKLQESEENDGQRLKNKAGYLHLCYICGDTSALGELHNLAEQSEVSNAHFWIAACYEYSDDFEKAAEEYEMSLQGTKTEEERASVIVSIAECLFKAGKQQEAYATVMQEIGEVTGPEAVYTLYKGLASLYRLAEEPELRALALEKALEIRPNDTSLLFDVAYAYGQEKLRPLEILHYNTLLQFEPDQTAALNNIGVCYERLQMPVHSVKFYRKAADLDHTLAVANLAYRFMNAGFTEEASQILDKAKQQPKLHPNVGRAIAAISEREEAESKIEEHLLNAAREQQRFLRSFAEAYFTERSNCRSFFGGAWRFPDGDEVTIIQTETDIKAEWDNDDGKYRLEGHVSNQAARITIYKKNILLPRYDEDSRGYAYLSPDGEQLHIMTLKEQEYSLTTLENAGDF
jgi:tetratricopeptide (TPR) repeat protein